ncbi:glycoside hydrolase [Altererythrobacter soli]|uniref:Glycoside hydrolase n=1 Tax=Croceibacterium soli TaxID=1739690 RepID=A0A6I4UV77_9SPHN|nr:O-antigen ligase family protein [Croceibacterium soli]MXP41367.1 glycoside hydrolase [Croceibacterium soli]
MTITFLGYACIVIGGMIVIAGSMRHALAFLVLAGLFSGSSAVTLPNGGSSIPPIYFALAFVYLRILVPHGGFRGVLPDAFRANRWLAVFALYGAAMAYIGPRLFAGDIDVYPMRLVARDSLFETHPLAPSSQNMTAGIYMLGTLFVAMAAWIGTRREDGTRTLVAAVLWATWLHAVLGIAALVARGTSFDAVFEFFRNSTYTQFNDQVGNFVRIRGVFAEASSYAAFGFGLMVANAELWYRSIRSRATGRAALLMAAVLFFSTSSTSYLGLAAYVSFFFARALLLPGAVHGRKIESMIAAMGGFVFLFAVSVALIPNLAEAILDMIARMTVEKSSSESGTQRLFWAMQGWEAFKASHGLGIGPGSFRSSSGLTAILGAMGAIGIVSFLAYIVAVFQPWRRSSWGIAEDDRLAVGSAFATAAALSLIPGTLSSANAHPGTNFAIFAGAALALRPFWIERKRPVREPRALATGAHAASPKPESIDRRGEELPAR